MQSIFTYGWVCVTALGCGVATAQDSDPDTLFLTWFGDPTTSIVAQWLEEGEPLPLTEGATEELPRFDVPRMDDVTIDGKPDDWDGRGFEVGFIAGPNGEVYDEADLSAAAKLGWDDRGLVVLLQIRDDVADESENPDMLWQADAVEVFVSTGVNSDQRYQMLIAPGADTNRDGPRQWFYDYRRDRASGDLESQYACAVVEGGYTVEIRLPWSKLGIDPQQTDEVAFQFYVDDRDGEVKTKGIWWHRDRDSNEQPESMYGLRLTDHAGPASLARSQVKRSGLDAELVVWANASLSDKVVTAKCNDVVIGEGVLEPVDGRALTTIKLDAPPTGTRWGTITAYVDGKPVTFAQPMKWMGVKQPESVAVSCSDFNKPVDTQAPPTTQTATTQIKQFGFSGEFLHRVTFDGLKPGSEYTLHIGGPDNEGLRFRTAPATLDRSVVFVTGGDVGTTSYVGQLHRQAAQWRPLFGLVGGDCAYANGRTPSLWTKYLRLWRKNMVDPDGRLIPMVCAIGNHEVDGSWGQPRERASLFLAFFDGRFPEKSYAAIDFGDYLSLLLLDSGHLSAHGGDQTDWLSQMLAARVDRPNLFTVYHVPAYPSHRDFEGKYSERAREHWVPLFDQYGVDVSFENHDHTYKRTHRLTGGEPDPAGVLYLGDGCWGVTPRTAATPEERSYLQKSISSRHVIRVTLDGKGRHFMAVDEEGRVLDRYDMEAE
jgi:hypothetical protein